MTLQAVIELLQLVNKSLEDLWTEREALRNQLLAGGYTIDQIDQLLGAARSDPQYREQARKIYAEMRENLEKAAKEEANRVSNDF